MSIIEKALEKLETSEAQKFKDSSASSKTDLLSKPDVKDPALVEPESLVESPELAEETASPRLTRSSQSFELDFKRLRRAGILTDGTSDRRLLEQYRLLKHALLRRAFDRAAKRTGHQNVVMVTSAVEGEGKTFTSLNLAMTIAKEVNHSVLLVDGDTVRRGLSRLCSVDGRPGLIDYLRTKEADLSEYLLKTNVDSLTLLPAGPPAEDVAELVSSVRMRALTEELSDRYSDRIVLIDTPPLLRDSSALVFAALAGQIAMVVEAEKTPQHVVQDALEALPAAETVGIILNKSNQRYKSEYEYGYY